ncbi:MAG TPA: M56 family metallopeptidase [Candidatus Evtepia faecigallinarum]|nr:M56 family metallopeptidase [Candidatus Evtepia faecigallinarum]
MIEWAVTSSVLILVVLVLRRCLKGRMSLRLQYALWALVLLRLLVPVSLGGTAMSVMNVMTAVPQPASGPVTAYPGGAGDQTPLVTAEAAKAQEAPAQPAANGTETEAAAPVSWGTVALAVWAVGAGSLGLWFLGVNLRFARRLGRDRRALAVEGYPLPVYVSGEVSTPCLFGLLRPCVYVPGAGDETVLRHTLAHELTHFRHGDHLWAVLRGVSLALHWYNPLVWAAAVLSRQDGELCCDEATVRRLGEEERAAYGRTLLAVTCQGPRDPLLVATSMTGSGRGIQERIFLLAKVPQTAAWTLLLVVCIAAGAVGCTFTGAQNPADGVSVTLAEGIDEPAAVTAYARTVTEEALDRCVQELGLPVTRARITDIQPISTGVATEKLGMACYLLSYRFETEGVDAGALPEGMRLEEGAITEWTGEGQPCLLLFWEDIQDGTYWEPVCVLYTKTIQEKYGTPERQAKYDEAYRAAAVEALEAYLAARAPSQETEGDRPAEEEDGLLAAEVALWRGGYDRPVGPGGWADLFPEEQPEVQVQEGYDPIYGQGDYWDQWSVEGFSALRYYTAAEGTWSANTIDVTRTDLLTPRGVQVGDSRAQVLAAYPEALTGDYWGVYPQEPDLLVYLPGDRRPPGEVSDLSQLEFQEMLGPAILFFFEGDTLGQITLTNMFD